MQYHQIYFLTVDGFASLFTSPCALKHVLFLLLQGLLIGALVSFIIAKAHEPYIAITVLEICIVLFFILIYMLALHHLLINLDWSLLVSVRFHNSNISLSPRVQSLLKGKQKS